MSVAAVKTDGDRYFEYGTARVKDFAITVNPEPKAKQRVKSISIRDEPFQSTKRFWTSLQCRFSFSHNIFRYFDYAEVFNRISERAPNDVVRYCVEKNDKGNRLLAVTNPNTPAVHYDQLVDLATRYGGDGCSYSDGIVRSTHKPRVQADNTFKIAGDDFVNQFVIDTPIDGFGRPNIYLSMMRQVCSNGSIGYGKAFRSEISTGKTDEDVQFALIRAMDGFNNEEGWIAMRERFESAAKSWASVNEVQRLYKVLVTQSNRGELKRIGREVVHTKDGAEVIASVSPIFSNFRKLTGDISSIYGLANLDSLSVKRQRTLPTACKIYDLINYATEVATHYSEAKGNRSLQAYVGDLITAEYDLEGTCEQYSDWRDFFINDDRTMSTMGAMPNRN